MRIRPKAIVFDYGHVLCAPQAPAEVAQMAALASLPVPQFVERYWRSRLAYDEAALDPIAYWHSIAEHLSRAEIDRLIDLDCRSWAHPDPIMPGWARQVASAGLRTALLSNMPVPVRDYVQRCAWLPGFDFCVFSCDLRISKPSPE